MARGEFGNTLSPWLKGIAKGFADIRPLAKPLGRILLEGNKAGLGTDWNGNPLAALAPSTIKRRKGTGPPLAPQSQDSRIVTNAQINAAGTGDHLVVEMSWDMPWLKYHRTGTKYMPARDITGIRPHTMDRIGDEVQKHFDGLLDFKQGDK